MPTTTLSIGAMVPSSNHSMDEHHSLETILRLKSWNEDPSLSTSYHSLKDKLEELMETSTQQQQGSGSHSSGKGLKRKRGSGGLSVTVYEEMMDTGRISLGLGQMENCRDMDEDSVTVLGLGHLDMTSGKNSSKGRDESIHGGSATTLSMQAEALSPGVLLQLGNMDEPDPDAAGAVGVGWQVESSSGSSRLYNAHTQDPVKLGLGSSQNASEYEPCGGERLLGLGNTGEKSANKRSWECPSFGSFQVPVVDEGSSSARVTCGGYMPSLLMGSSVFPPLPSLQIYENGTAAAVEEDFMEQNLSMSFHQQSSTTSTSSRSGHSDRPLKVCKFRGCGKGPRGASGLCIAHGGGRRFVWFICPVGSAHFPC